MARSSTTKPERRSIREESRAVYRQAIREAAIRVFGQTGFREAKITDIAAEAGVATGTLYNYFSSKEDIFQSILEEGRERLREAMTVPAKLDDPMDRIHGYVGTMLTFLEEHGALFVIHMQAVGSLHTPPQDEADEAFRQEVLDLFVHDLAAAGERIRQDYPRAILGAALGGLFHSTIIAWVEAGCPAGLRDQTDIILDLFLNGAANR